MSTNQYMFTQDMSYVQLVTELEKSTLTATQVDQLLLTAVLEKIGKAKRVFNYGKTFAGTAAGCAPTFTRSFTHVDWIDGESMVQAEESSIEEGFNSRFHKIEDDLDALAADIRTLAGCLADMRAELAARLSELRTEINQINLKVFGQQEGGWVLNPPVTTFPTPLAPLPIQLPQPIPGWPTYPGIKDIIDNIQNPIIRRDPLDPIRAVIGGKPAIRLDVQDVNGLPFEIWSADGGIVMLQAPAGVKAGDQPGRTVVNPDVKLVGDVAAWTAEHDKTLTETLAGGATVGKIVEKFGDERLAGGVTMRDALAGVPDTATVGKSTDLLDLLSNHAAENVARDGRVTETVVANVGVQGQAKKVEEVAITEFKALPDDARKAMADAGIKTVGALLDAQPAQLAKKLDAAGVQVSAADIARWGGEARVLGQITGPR